jgi:hypothetical protein
MPTSAHCTYSAVAAGGAYNYELQLHNTSPTPFDIYSFVFGFQYNVPYTYNFPLQDVVLIGAPAGWTGILALPNGLIWQTNFQGSSISSGYIMAGQSGAFRFQSSTPPPATLVFGCCFYDNGNQWGFCSNGTATNDEHGVDSRRPPYFAVINPLVLLIGDQLFARLNLPRPLPLTRSLSAQLMPGIRSMTPAQRESVAQVVDNYVAALTEVRAALNEP